MWYEILPTFGVITAFMALPTVSFFVINRLAFNNTYQRRTSEPSDFMFYFLRDQRLIGKGWVSRKLSEADELD